MSKAEEIRAKMVEAIKSHDKTTKDSLSLLVGALKNAEIDKKSPLTEDEENAVIQKEVKQAKEALDLCPSDRTDLLAEYEERVKLYEQFCPALMSEAEIDTEIRNTLSELGINQPTNKDKGRIMKVLMPKVKGKADGKLVNQRVAEMMN